MEVHSGVALGWSSYYTCFCLRGTAHPFIRQREFSCLQWIVGNSLCRNANQHECEKAASGGAARVSGIRSGLGLLTGDATIIWKSKACGDSSVSLVNAPNPEVSRKRCRGSATRAQAAAASKKNSKATKQKPDDWDVEDTDQDLRSMKVATFKVPDQEENWVPEDAALVNTGHGRASNDAGSILNKWGSWSEVQLGADERNAAVIRFTEQALIEQDFAPSTVLKGPTNAGCTADRRTEGIIESITKGAVCERGVSGRHRRAMIGGISGPCQRARMEEKAMVIKAGGGTLELLFEAMRTSVKNKESVDVADEGIPTNRGALADSVLGDEFHKGLGLGGRELESLGLWNLVPTRNAAKAANGGGKGRRVRGLNGEDAGNGKIVVCSETGLQGTCPGRQHRLRGSKGGDVRAGYQAEESGFGVAGGVTGVERTGVTGVGHTPIVGGAAVEIVDDTIEAKGPQHLGGVELDGKRGKSLRRLRRKVQETADLLSGSATKQDHSQPLNSGVALSAAAEGLPGGLRLGRLTTEGLQSGSEREGIEGGGSVREGSGARPPAEQKTETQKRRGLVSKEVGVTSDSSGSARRGRIGAKRGRQVDRGTGALVGGLVANDGGSAGAVESNPPGVSVETTPVEEKVDVYKDHPLRLQRQRCERCGQEKELADYRKTVSTATGFNAFCRACHAAINAARRGKVLPQESLEGRTCTDCGRFRPAVEFALKRDMPDGLKFCCRGCDSLKQADYRDRVNRRRLELTQQECANCLETKPIGDFNRHRGLVTGHDTYCKQCKRERYLLWKADRRPLERPIVRDKKCARCEMTKPASEYALSVTNFDGLQTLCRGCVLLTRPGVAAGLPEQKSGRGTEKESGTTGSADEMLAVDGSISNVDL